MEQGVAATNQSPAKAWLLTGISWALSRHLRHVLYLPKNGAVVGVGSANLAAELESTVGGKWTSWASTDDRVWLAMRSCRRKLLGCDVLVVTAGSGDVADDRSLEWIRSGLAEMYRQPLNPRLVVGVEVGRGDVDRWLQSGAWGLVDVVVPKADARLIEKALRGV